jgi:hypothetical protein
MAITMQADISRMIVLGNKQIFTKNFEKIPVEYTQFTTPKTANKWTEYYDSMGNLTAGQEKFENVALTYGKVTQAYQTSIATRGWYNGYSHSKEAAMADLFGVINSVKAKELARTMRDLEEGRAIYWLDNAFATVTLSDGTYLCSNSHPLFNSAGSYNDTLTTGALSPDTLKAAIQMFADFKNHAGGPMQSDPKNLITHKYNMIAVKEILGSGNQAYEMSNTKNVLPDLKPVFSRYLSSKTAWFLEDTDYEHILFQWHKDGKTEFGEAEDEVTNPGDMYLRAIAYYNTGALPNVGIVGSQGT